MDNKIGELPTREQIDERGNRVVLKREAVKNSGRASLTDELTTYFGPLSGKPNIQIDPKTGLMAGIDANES